MTQAAQAQPGDAANRRMAMLEKRVAELDAALTAARGENAALREAERRYRKMIEQLPDAIYIHQDQKIAFINRAGLDLLGAHSEQEVLGRSTFEFIHPEFRDLVRSRHAQMIQSGAAVDAIDQKRLRLDGTTVEVSTIALPYLWQGRPAVLVVNRDITRRKQMEDAMRAEEDLRARLVELLPDAIYIHQDGIVAYVNSAGLRQIGAISPQDVIGKPQSAFIAPEFRERVSARRRQVIESRGATDFLEIGRLRLDGTRYVAEAAGIPITWKGMDASLLIVRDLTESRRHQLDLAEKSDLLEATLNTISEGLCVFGSDRRLRAWNKQFMSMMGYPSEFARAGTPFEDFLRFSIARGDHGEGDPKALLAERVSRVQSGSITFDRTGPNGRHFLVNTNHMADGGFATTISDITERKASESATAALNAQLLEQAEQLQRSNEDLQQFAYVASHDLQEPLRMVSGYCQLLEKRYADKLDADARDFIDFAVDAATRMQKLINDLLQYSRIGTRAKAFEPVPLNEAVEAATANLRLAIEETGASVQVEALPTVKGERSQIIQLFQNLVGNAIKFCKDRQPEIRISAAARGDRWEIAVRDNGIGIEEAYRERIFLIFQRLHGREEYPGTGIGLALCKKIVSRHGGEIRVESETDQGSAFIFTLPQGEGHGSRNGD